MIKIKTMFTLKRLQVIRFRNENMSYLFEAKEDVFLEIENKNLQLAKKEQSKNLHKIFTYMPYLDVYEESPSFVLSMDIYFIDEFCIVEYGKYHKFVINKDSDFLSNICQLVI
jgi:hypothetical protein